MKKLFSILLAFALVLSVFGGSTSNVYAAENDNGVKQVGTIASPGLKFDVPTGVFDNDPDKDFANYVDHEFMIRSENYPGPMREPASTMLPADSMELKIVNNLQPQMKKVADGEESLAAFYVDFIEAGIPWYYTAADLGVSYIYDSNGANQDALDAFYANAYPDTHSIMMALLYSLPYDVFWFDKTSGMGFDPGDIYYGTLNATGEQVIYYNESLFFYFCVCPAYQDANAEQPQFTVNINIAASVQASAQRAASIVAANKKNSDVGKLYAYRDAICSLTEYNFPAVENNYDYGNPWQLIWVFDGDPSTTVVCEGYSKAFQYLCDMTAFNHSNISCRIVSGDMYSGGGGGGHMWNVVTMEDGSNYLVDVTNCDQGSYGGEDLFLDGASGNPYNYYTAIGRIQYYYDDDMWEIYDYDRLVLSGSHYQENLVITKAKLDLQSKIGIRLYFQAPHYAQTASITFEGDDIPFDESKAVRMSLTRDGNKNYNYKTEEFLMVFPEITAKKMSQHVRLTVYDENGNIIPVYYSDEGTWHYNGFEYSAVDWANRIIRTQPSTAAVNMAKALLNYGGNAQVYLSNYKPESPTNPNNYFASENAAVRPLAAQDASIPAVAYNLGLDQIKLDLAAETSIRIYFNKPVSVQVDGKDATVYNSGNTWLVIIKGITSRLLDHRYVIDVYGADGSAFGMVYSALSWANDKIANGPAAAQPTARALYLYNQAALEYLGPLN